MTLTVGSLFSGIGGMDLGLERAGHKVIWQSEIDPYACKVLKKHWPNVSNLGDITKIDWSKVEPVDIICGGYPCQPFSHAGKRNGTADARHLWPAMHNAICQLRPRYALMENVRGHLSMGFGDVLADLAEIGYDAEWQVIPAAAVGALHKRDRVFIVAYPNSSCTTNGRQREVVQGENSSRGNDRNRGQRNVGQISLGSAGQNTSVVADTDNARGRTPTSGIDSNGAAQIKKRQNVAQSGVGRRSKNVANTDSRRQQKRDTPIWGVSVFNAVSCQQFAQQWATEPNVGRVADGVSNRLDRLRGLGNAVVPQVAELVGRLIGEHAKQLK
jgi:DNA-cytosine methyltransferase